MGEYESNIRYAKSVGAGVNKPQLDRRTTSQRVTDEMNELRTKNKQLREALQGIMDLNISGIRYGNPAKEAWDAAIRALKSNKPLHLTPKAEPKCTCHPHDLVYYGCRCR